MEWRIHPTFARRLMVRSLGVVAAGMACLGLALWGERDQSLPLRAAGYAGFLVCVVGLWLVVRRAARGCPCPECGRWLPSCPDRDPGRPLAFACRECGVEWGTQCTIESW
jgi:hypothetical protein